MMTPKARKHFESTGKLAISPDKRKQLAEADRRRDKLDNGKPERTKADFARALSRR